MLKKQQIFKASDKYQGSNPFNLSMKMSSLTSISSARTLIGTLCLFISVLRFMYTDMLLPFHSSFRVPICHTIIRYINIIQSFLFFNTIFTIWTFCTYRGIVFGKNAKEKVHERDKHKRM